MKRVDAETVAKEESAVVRGAVHTLAAVAVAFLLAPKAACAALLPLGLDAPRPLVHFALHSDLDVRDAYNRPVSRELIQRQMSDSARAADPGREVSLLPMAKLLWDALDRILLGFVLRSGLPAPFRSGTPRWNGAKRLALRCPAAAVFGSAPAAASICLRPRSAAVAGPNCLPVVLLC